MGFMNLYESLRAELLHDQSHLQLIMVQLPAFNTPQFEWARSHLSHEPQPIPPIYQPESAADSIVRAIQWGKPETLVGFPTVKAIVANAFAPRLLDRYLAKTGYASQEMGEVSSPRRADNLWKPVRGHARVHGRFDAKAQFSRLLLVTQEELTTLIFLAGLVVAALAVLIARAL